MKTVTQLCKSWHNLDFAFVGGLKHRMHSIYSLYSTYKYASYLKSVSYSSGFHLLDLLLSSRTCARLYIASQRRFGKQAPAGTWSDGN